MPTAGPTHEADRQARAAARLKALELIKDHLVSVVNDVRDAVTKEHDLYLTCHAGIAIGEILRDVDVRIARARHGAEGGQH